MLETLVTQAEYDAYTQGKGVRIAYFGAEWCGPCKLLRPLVEELLPEYEGLQVRHIDIDEAEDLASALDIRGIPDVRLFVDGNQHSKHLGANADPIIHELDTIFRRRKSVS